MKKLTALLLAVATCISCAFALTACNNDDGEYAPPPADVVNPDGDSGSGDTQTPDDGSQTTQPSQNGVLENAVTVKIGLNDSTDYLIHMYDNAAANTMLGYLSSSEMRFPTYTYNAEVGFVAQNIRGSYTRDDEKTVADIKKGELYLMSGGQLRLYFKDIAGANIKATKVGYFANSSNIENAVTTAYTENLGDEWGVDVYFLITKNPQPKNTQTRVKVTMNDKVVYANINDTVTGKAFLELLPFNVTGYRAEDDICCSVSEELANDPAEDEIWNIGEIGWFGGWFTILCDNEAQFTERNRTIIGKFEDQYIDTVTSLDGSIDITVTLA